MKNLLIAIISLGLGVASYAQTRSVLVDTNNRVVQPTNFWSVDASNARSGLGLGSAATNSSSVFQPSSSVLSNLASSNGLNLTNLTAANVVGTVALATNVTGVVAITNGGTGATNAATARTNLGLSVTNDVTFNSVSANLIDFTSSQVFIEEDGGAISFIEKVESNTVIKISGDTDPVYLNPIYWNDAGVRSNIGLGATWLTNTNVTNFRTDIGLGTTNSVQFSNLTVHETGSPTNLGIRLGSTNYGLWGSGGPSSVGVAINGTNRFEVYETFIRASAPIQLDNTTNAATTRTNLGLGWSALTNTNTGTGLVSVDTNGEVISPTNFWQQAPIASTYQESIPVTNSTNLANASRSLHLHSLSPSINNVTNVILLRTNGTTFAGDNATIVHKGPTNSMTVVRSAGGTNDLITMTRFNEAVKFVYYGSVWNLDHNLSYVEPIYFAGTNTVAHIAETRTNLGLPLTALTNTNNANFQAAVFVTNSAPTNSANVNTVNFNTATHWMEVTVKTNGTNATFRIPLFQ